MSRALPLERGLSAHPKPTCPRGGVGHALCLIGLPHPRGIRKPNGEHLESGAAPADSKAARKRFDPPKRVLNRKPRPCFLSACSGTCCAQGLSARPTAALRKGSSNVTKLLYLPVCITASDKSFLGSKQIQLYCALPTICLHV